MLKVLHKGIQANFDLNDTDFTGDYDHDRNLTYIQGLEEGRLVTIDSDGYVALADGLYSNGLHPIGFLLNDAAGPSWENTPGLASKKAAVIVGNCVVITDQIDTTLTFTPGQPLYCGTGAKKGLVTNVPVTDAIRIGYAKSAASASDPNLEIVVA